MKLVRAWVPLLFAALLAALANATAPRFFCHMAERSVSSCCCERAHTTTLDGEHTPAWSAPDCCERIVAPAGSNVPRPADIASDVPAATVVTVLGEPLYAFPELDDARTVPAQSRGPPAPRRLFLLKCSWLS